jgi:hypothetical protein
MKTNDLIDALKCHVMRFGDCEVELFVLGKRGKINRTGLTETGHGPWDDRRPRKPGPMFVLKGEV